MTAVVPINVEIGPTMRIGRKLATETSIPSTPKTRPRTSSGRSSWSWVCDGIATQAVGDAGEEGDDDDDRQERGHAGQVEPAGRVGPLRASRLIGPAADSAAKEDPERDEPALDDSPAREVAAVRVEQQDAGHDPEPERQDDDREVLGLEPEGLLARRPDRGRRGRRRATP